MDRTRRWVLGDESAGKLVESRPMAKAAKREYVWLQCTETGDLNYRTSVNVMGGTPKLTLKKYCPRLKRRTVHKIKRK
jgi:large subunit ribosomal protein L33